MLLWQHDENFLYAATALKKKAYYVMTFKTMLVEGNAHATSWDSWFVSFDRGIRQSIGFLTCMQTVKRLNLQW